MVFIPGWTFSCAIFERQLAGLSDRYRVIAIDPRSQGRSTTTAAGSTYGVPGIDIGTFLQKMDISDAVLVGWSTGCLEAFATVRAHGVDRIKGFGRIDMSPKALSSTDGDWVEGSIEEIAEVSTDMLGTTAGQKGLVEFYATEVMVQRKLTVDFEALADTALSGTLRVATDVWPEEPFDPGHALRRAESAVLSAHRAGALYSCFYEMGERIVEDIALMNNGLPPSSCKRAEYETVTRMRSRPVQRS